MMYPMMLSYQRDQYIPLLKMKVISSGEPQFLLFKGLCQLIDYAHKEGGYELDKENYPELLPGETLAIGVTLMFKTHQELEKFLQRIANNNF